MEITPSWFQVEAKNNIALHSRAEYTHLEFKVEGPLSPSERTRYDALKRAILDNIDVAHTALMRVAQDLTVVRDESTRFNYP